MAFNPTNGLCTLQQVKQAMSVTDDADDDELNICIDAASRQVEYFCGRRFWQDATVSARVFKAETPFLCDIDDMMTTVGLIVQSDPYGDGSFPNTWQNPTLQSDGSLTGGDFQLEPLNGLLQGQAWAFERFRPIRSFVDPIYGGLSYPIPFVVAQIKVTAKWGWNYVPTPVSRATVYQTVQLFKAADTPFGATPFAEVGIMRLKPNLHPTAEALLQPYSRSQALVL
jgi:hypothetical protein